MTVGCECDRTALLLPERLAEWPAIGVEREPMRRGLLFGDAIITKIWPDVSFSSTSAFQNSSVDGIMKWT